MTSPSEGRFTGRVFPNGKLALDRPKDYDAHIRSLAGQFVELVLRKQRSKRSTKANAFYWSAVVGPLAEHLGYDPQDMHEVLAMHFLRIEDCPVTGAPRRKRTPKTDTAEFARYVDDCIRLAAEQGVVVEDR